MLTKSVQFMVALGLCCSFSTAKAADNDLVRQALVQLTHARQQMAALPQDVRTQQIAAEIALAQADLARALGQAPTPTPVPPPPPPPPPPQVIGHYCAAACKDFQGNADTRYVKGAAAPFEAQAQELAINATQSAYSCNYGVVVTGCSDQYSSNKFYCAAACLDFQGNLDTRYVRGSAATSALEALTLATQQTNAAFSCNYGVKELKCSDAIIPTYCVAACKDFQGNADMRYSQGSTGSNEAEATANALTTVQNAYSCNYGVMITQCSNH